MRLSIGYRSGHRLASHISYGRLWHIYRGSTDMSQQMIFNDRIAFGVTLSKDISKIRYSTATLLVTTITEVLTDAHIYRYLQDGQVD